MSRSPFGWSYPPGAENDPSAPYNQVDPPCEVCGKDPADCICPECPTCGEQGDPKCYADPPDNGHGLERTEEQIESRAALERLADKGIHADTNPSMTGDNGSVTWFYEYLRDADETVRGIAAKALASGESNEG